MNNIVKFAGRIALSVVGGYIGYKIGTAEEKLFDKMAEKRKAKKQHEWLVRHGYEEDKEFDCGK